MNIYCIRIDKKTTRISNLVHTNIYCIRNDKENVDI
jgi:hypothetical protein